MTKNERDEAIRVIKSECYIFNLLNLDRTTIVNTALDKAVEALKAEPCEDAISREAAFDEIIWNSDNGLIDANEAIEALRKLPAVEPERKKGKWKYTADGYPVCTRCGGESCGHGGVKGYETKFCPNCGAKMEV